MIRNDTTMTYRYFVDTTAALRASDDFSPMWDRVAVANGGLIMLHRLTRRMIALVAGEAPVAPCLVSPVSR